MSCHFYHSSSVTGVQTDELPSFSWYLLLVLVLLYAPTLWLLLALRKQSCCFRVLRSFPALRAFFTAYGSGNNRPCSYGRASTAHVVLEHEPQSWLQNVHLHFIRCISAHSGDFLLWLKSTTGLKGVHEATAYHAAAIGSANLAILFAVWANYS